MSPAKPSRIRFIVIDLLAVLAILGLLALMTPPLVFKSKASSNVRACQSNLRQIAANLQLWADDRNHGAWPAERGIQFLLVLVRDGELGLRDLDIFCCPATDDSTESVDAAARRPGSGLADFAHLDARCISYAGRDGVRFPVNPKKLSEELIAADDNDGRANHPRVTNVVYADSHVATIDVTDYKKELGGDAEWVPVGPESPDPDLRRLLIK
jgi:prepilin-type processing-associated H-X9-DG protein